MCDKPINVVKIYKDNKDDNNLCKECKILLEIKEKEKNYYLCSC